MTTVAMEEYELMKDSKYRLYVAAVDKALKNFDYTSEWADLISALGKLNKVLLSYTKFPVIPRRIKISKRLAQCMHPALPSGVHLKALETYDIIFRCMGTNRLACELFIYSAGLFPLMSHAAMNIRPTLLTIYETHFVPLRERLRPALSGFLSGILPGLDTGTDHFDRTNQLLENVCEGVEPPYFYTCIWQCVANNSPVRLPAISYVLAHYSRKLSMEDQLYLMGNDIGLMVSGLCAAVQDSSVLVQRSALDLLMVCFPMQNKQLLYADMVRLVTAALSTILRRDMSLNRRLYSWLLETDPNVSLLQVDHNNLYQNHTPKHQSVAYDLLNDALKIILKKCSTEVPLDVKPYRLLTSLFDKPQIGPVILDNVLYDVFRTLYLSCLHQQRHRSSTVRVVSFNGDLTSLKNEDGCLSKQFVTKHCQELIKNANLLFNTLQSYYIWSYIEKLYIDAVKNIKNCKFRDKCHVNEIGSGHPYVLELCILTDFLLDIIPIESYTESTSSILPSLFTKIVSTLRANIGELNDREITHSLQLCTRILSKIQPIALQKKMEETVEEGKSLNDSSEKSEPVTVPEDAKSESGEHKLTLEKSKSDSRINENLNNGVEKMDISADDSRERSYSNQMLKKKPSPKIDKKSKNKKSKSSSKLYDLKNGEIDNTITEHVSTDKSVTDSLQEVQEKAKISNVENKHFVKCIEEYKKFYVRFITSRILPNVRLKESFEKLVCNKEERTECLISLLENRLREYANCEFVPVDYAKISLKNTEFLKPHSPLGQCSLEYEKAMSVASNILLEFSAFPNVLDAHPEKSVPSWLEALMVAACSKESSTEVQITAMNTLLETFSLAHNQLISKKEDRNTNIVITSIVDIAHVRYIEANTVVVEEISQILWQLLGVLSNQSQLMTCVTLLYQIHNTFDSKQSVEHIVCHFLTKENISVAYMKQFFLLWHLGRDLSIKLPPNKSNIKNFDRLLLKILDNLQNEERPNLQLLAQCFLTHSLLHNDIPRLINPMLMKLLASNTARVSIKHVNIQDSDSQSDTASHDNSKIDDIKTKRVYAVSSVNGNIMYHIADGPSPKPMKKKWFTFAKAGKKYTSSIINMTTSITENSNFVTKKNKDFKGYNLSPKSEKEPKNVKLIINPLSSKEVYPVGVDGSYSKRGSNSSLESLSSNENEEPQKTPQDKNSVDRDSGFDSLKNKSQPELLNMINSSKEFATKSLLESMEPISDGIKAQPVNGTLSKIPKSFSFDEKLGMEKTTESSLVQSWSYCISDSANLNCELEISKSAEEFFRGRGEEEAIATDILNSIIDKVFSVASDTTESPNRPSDLDLKPKVNTTRNIVLYPIHSHMCLYYEVFDSNQVLYALRTLRNCILADSHLFIKCLATSGIKNLKNNEILYLLARHRKSMLGFGFTGDLNADYVNFYRGYTFLDVIITVCLNYARTFHPFMDESSIMVDEINNNLKIQLESLEILDIIIRKLISMVAENSKGLCSYIGDLLLKCKLQKILLNCLLTSVRNFDEEMTFAEEILAFNKFQLSDNSGGFGEQVEAFQMQILRVIHSLIILEHSVFTPKPPPEGSSTTTTATNEQINSSVVLIPQQQIFLSAIMSALRHSNMKHIHEKWLNMVTSCLPYFGDSLKQITISVIHQICSNIEEIASSYKKVDLEGELCSDYAVTQLESLTVLCHYCLLDSSQTVNQNVPVNPSTPVSNPGEIINNLFNVFLPPLSSGSMANKQNFDNYQSARKAILSHMPRIISSIAKLWQTIIDLESDYNGLYGNSKTVKQQLLEFLSPISVHHSTSFLAAIAVAWYERRNLFSSVKTVLPEPNAGQTNLVALILAIRVIPLDNLVQTVTAVIKSPPPIEGLSADLCLDVSVLELFYCYMRNASATQLSEAWGSILGLIREGCSLSPPAQFLLAALLHEIMIKCCPLEDRKDQKDLQDVTAKLIDCVSQVCGSCLEQTTWLRRNFAVKEQEEDTISEPSIISGSNSEIFVNSNYSVQAQLVLSEILSPILDICFGSSEKDKVNNILTSLMCNIVPYLKTHTAKNMPSFSACSKLLSSLSSYQYTRKAWKKDVFDLLLDNQLFQMDYACLKFWRVIVDNLMTHDNTTFRDLMNRVSMNQSGSLSIFSSREQEYEQKAQLLKRLAYVIFCSEMDQYAKYMPDIQEQLTSSLRLSVPNVQAQVFLCFRIILIRMSPLHVTSLWPIIISEMLQVFLQIEQELSTDTEEFRYCISHFFLA
ncbi:unnamed protein product [Acanthoscelides obtectus]|uniref:Uncharacterized protein n=1 Tax=Acanthoscelides obtectus TaxID=200917 RepID=A0A9P0K8F9_ACAOB|nr:unnamed protein product [Acanthoscelides obtectus]CAK1622810.1 Protein dopey-1 homolog [Acanthoscelides obtectus]